MSNIERRNILGCPFDAISFEETISAMTDAVRSGKRLQIVPGSIDFVMKAKRDRQFAQELWSADLVVADGVPIVWSATLLGTPLRGRVSGTELVWNCGLVSQQTGSPVVLLGARDGVAPRAAKQMFERFPGATIHAIPTPWPLGHQQSLQIADRVKELGAGIVLVALGAPRQERWVQTYLAATGASVGIGVGSAFDIICGDKPRAPNWMQGMGLEWFHRMLQEPGRLGRRYLIEDSPFLLHLTRELVARRMFSRGSGA